MRVRVHGIYRVSADNAIPFTSTFTASLVPSPLLPVPRTLSELLSGPATRPSGNSSSLRSTQPGCPDTALSSRLGPKTGAHDTAIFSGPCSPAAAIDSSRSPHTALVEVVTLDALAFYNDVTSFVFWETAADGVRFQDHEG